MRDDIGGSPGGRGEPGGPRERQSWDTEVYNVGAPPPARRGAAPSGPVVPVGSAVLLGVSRGRPPAERPTLVVPEVLGMSQNDALDTLQAEGFIVEALLTPSDTVDEDYVASQYPPPHSAATSGSQAAILISGGPAAETARATVLPDVVGMTEEQATATLAQAGLRTAVVHDFNAAVARGVVMAQEPNATDVDEALVPEKKRSKAGWLWALLILLLIVIAAGVVYMFVGGGGEATVPNITGKTVSAAETALADAGLDLGTVTEKANTQVAAGTIVSQDPKAGTVVDEGSRVNVVAAAAPEGVAVPDVTGSTVAKAQSALEQDGLTYNVTSVYSDEVAKDIVISQSPQAGKRVEQGTQIALSVSRGPAPPANIKVPNVIGMTTSRAQQEVKDAGLTSAVRNVYSDKAPSGTVASQSPVGGASVAPKAQVLLLVSKGPAPEESTKAIVPDVVGMLKSDATTRLKNAGFTVTVFEAPSDQDENVVVAQFPSPGSEQPKGAAVAITVSSGSPY